MKKLVIICLGLFLVYTLDCLESSKALSEPNDMTVDEWYQKAKGRNPEAKLQQEAIVSFGAFEKILEKYINLQKRFLSLYSWVGQRLPVEDRDLKNDFVSEIAMPFAVKVLIRDTGKAYFWGDLHGDIAAFVVALKKLKEDGVINDNFEIIQPNTYFFFLGDMVDRGAYQVDLLSLILIVNQKNMGKVFLIRGNHEDLRINKDWGFTDELEKLYQKDHPKEKLNSRTYYFISFLYNLMPDVAFVGCNGNYLQCCHGGIEILYNPKKLLAASGDIVYQLINKPFTFQREKFLDDILNSIDLGSLNIDITAAQFFSQKKSTISSPFQKADLGFLWGDFNTDLDSKTYYQRNRGLFSGQDFTQSVLNSYSTDRIRVRGIMRAHQHNSSLPGILNQANTGAYPIFKNSVISNLSTSLFTGVVAFNEITFSNDYNLWRLTNYSGNDQAITSKKEAFLSEWKNNFEPPVKEVTAQEREQNAYKNKNILEDFNELFSSENPDFEELKNMLKEVTRDPDGKITEEYTKAQKTLEQLKIFSKAINDFNADDYPYAQIGFYQLIDSEYLKFKAREYFAKSVIEDHNEEKFDEVLTLLQKTLLDDASSAGDKRNAQNLMIELQELMQPVTP